MNQPWVYVCSHPEPLSHLPPHTIPQGHPSAPALSTLSHASNLDWQSISVRPHRRQPTRLPHPWDSPGKTTGVGCHFLLQCMKVKSESEAVQSCPTLSDSMDCSLPGSFVHGIFQARVLEWGAIAFSKSWLHRTKWYHILFTSGGQSIGASSLVISPSNEYSMLISFRIDYFDILTVQGTLKGVLQHHNSKASILWRSVFFMVQLMTIRKPEL